VWSCRRGAACPCALAGCCRSAQWRPASAKRCKRSGGRFRENCATADVCDAALCRARTFFALAFFAVALTPTAAGTQWCRSRVCSPARAFFRALLELWITSSYPVPPSPCPRRSSPPHPGLFFRGRGCRAGTRWAAARATHGSKRVARARFSGGCRPSLVWGGYSPSLVWAAAAHRQRARRPPVGGVRGGRPSVVRAAAAGR